MIRLLTLGSLDLRGDDDREIRPILSQPKRLALLAYLALPGSRAFHRRDELLALFWPERDQEHARAALSRAIYYLRHSLGDGVIVSRGDDEVAVTTSRLSCDAAAFKAAGDGDARALELYRGDFMPGFFVSDLPGVEQWVERERTELRSRAASLTWALSDSAEVAGNLELALARAERGTGLAPYDETRFRRYLSLLDRTGDRAGAIRAYEAFTRRMAYELDLTPAPETQTVVEAIRARTRAFDTPSPETWASGDDNGAPPPPTETIPASTSHASAERSVRGFPLTRFATIAAVVGFAVLATSAVLMRPTRSLERGRVAVAVFANRTGDASLDPLGALAADAITQSLVQTGLVPSVAPPQRVDDSVDARGVERLGQRTHAATIVTGAFYRDGATLRFDARIVDLLRGNVAWAVQPIVVPADSAKDAIDQVTQRATGAVAALMNARFASWFPLATAPPTFAALQEFGRGVDLQLRGDPIKAIEHYHRAIDLDTAFTWARLQLAVAHMNLFEEAKADSIADAVVRGRDQLTPLQRYWLDWMRGLRTEDYFAQYRAMRAAADLAPERFLYSFAGAARTLNRPRESLAALEKLGSKSPYFGGSIGYWDMVAKSYHQLGEHRRELVAAKQARVDNPDDVYALEYEIRAFVALGHMDSVRARIENIPAYSREDARNVALWEHKGITLVVLDVAEELRAHGHPNDAMRALEQVIAWHRSRPVDEARTPERRGELARALYLANHLDEAETAFTALRKVFPNDVVNIGHLGAIAARRGDRARAEQALALLESMKPTAKRRNSQTSYWQARIAALLGDRESAVRHLVDLLGEQGRYMHPLSDFDSLKGYAPFEELLKPKG